MSGQRVIALSIAAVIVAASCAGTEPPPFGTDRQPPAGTRQPHLTAACGPVEFDPAAVDLDRFAPFDEEIASFVGEGAREEFEASLEWWQSLEWSVVERSDSVLLLFGQSSGPPGGEPTFGYAQFALHEDGWQATGWGQCRIVVSADGFGVASFVVDPAKPPDPAALTLHLLATERACAGGLAPGDRTVTPVLVESSDVIEITVLVESPSGDQTCPSNPAFPLVVELDSPLGDRVIIDGAFRPAEQR